MPEGSETRPARKCITPAYSMAPVREAGDYDCKIVIDDLKYFMEDRDEDILRIRSSLII